MRKSMRITYIPQHFVLPGEPGGSRPYEFARRMAADGHHVTMICGGQEPMDRVVDGILRSTSPSRVLQRHGDELRSYLEARGLTDIRVFGSTARGQDRWDSDLDIVAVLPAGASLLEVVEWEAGLRRLAGGLRVDLVPDPAGTSRRTDAFDEAVPL